VPSGTRRCATPTPGDLNALASATEGRGLLRDAARLRKLAVTYGDCSAVPDFIRQWHALDPADLNAAEWVIAKVPLGQSSSVADLLEALRAAGSRKQVKTLLARDPAAHASLDNASNVASLLRTLQAVDAGEQVKTPLARDPGAHVCVDDPPGIAELLRALRSAGADEQADVLARRVAMQASLDWISIGS
jgi:uncharacterized protein YidB (DUF937 family)